MDGPRMILAAEKTRADFNSLLKTSCPTDIIALDDLDAVCTLSSLWMNPNDESEQIDTPADIFFSSKIPLPDCIIDRSAFAQEDEVLRFRVQAWTYENAPRHHRKTMALVGLCVITINNRLGPMDVVVPMWVIPGINKIICAFVYIQNMGNDMQEYNFRNRRNNSEFIDLTGECISTWYGIQVALLHPTIQYVFRDPERADIKDYTKSRPHKYKRKKTRYVKLYRIGGDDINDKIYIGSGEHKFIRKTMKWWVIGHFRTYKNGKTIFVPGYWKGPLRNTQIPVEPREREIVTDGISVDNSTESVHN